MPWLEPVTLSGPHAQLKPLSHDHLDGLTEAVRDGELWKLWYTFIPKAEDMAKEIDRRLGLQKAGSMMPWTVFDAAAALLVEKMRAELYRNAIELLEGVAEQQQFALGIERAALHAFGVPGRADFDPPVGGVDIHVGRHARDLAVGIEHGERQHRP